MIAAGEFLEWADVFGNLYGTCAPETERLLLGRPRRRPGDRRAGRAAGPRVRPRVRVDLRAAAVVRGARAAAARPQQGQRRGDPAAPRRGVVRGVGLSRLRLRDRQRRTRRRPSTRCGRSSWPSGRACTGCGRSPTRSSTRSPSGTRTDGRSGARHGADRGRRERGRRRLQGRRGRARAAEARPRRGRDPDARGAAVRQAADLRGDHAPAR